MRVHWGPRREGARSHTKSGVGAKMKRFLALMLLTMTTLLTSAQMPSTKDVPKPPVAKKVAKPQIMHGVDITDQYFWLREKPKPEVKAYLDEENTYTDA